MSIEWVGAGKETSTGIVKKPKTNPSLKEKAKRCKDVDETHKKDCYKNTAETHYKLQQITKDGAIAQNATYYKNKNIASQNDLKRKRQIAKNAEIIRNNWK